LRGFGFKGFSFELAGAGRVVVRHVGGYHIVEEKQNPFLWNPLSQEFFLVGLAELQQLCAGDHGVAELAVLFDDAPQHLGSKPGPHLLRPHRKELGERMEPEPLRAAAHAPLVFGDDMIDRLVRNAEVFRDLPHRALLAHLEHLCLVPRRPGAVTGRPLNAEFHEETPTGIDRIIRHFLQLLDQTGGMHAGLLAGESFRFGGPIVTLAARGPITRRLIRLHDATLRIYISGDLLLRRFFARTKAREQYPGRQGITSFIFGLNVKGV
jgi:hypothetical protein